jgi:hypothetical protein
MIISSLFSTGHFMTTTVTETPPQTDPIQMAFQFATGYIVSAALQTAVKLGIPDRLIDGPRGVADLASATGTNEDALYRVLRALTTVNVFQEVAPRTFGLTPISEVLRSDKPGAHDMALWISSPLHFRVYSNAMHSVKTGQPAVEKAVGMPAFEYLAREPELSEIFNNAMTSFSAMIIPAVLEAYDFSGIDVLVDVAGGHGAVLTSILQRYPKMRGIVMDLEHVIAGARPKIEAMKLQDRCEAVAGDFFKAVPSGGDAYIMKHIIHDWDDERASVILRNIKTALAGKPRGRVILLEAVVQSTTGPDFVKLLDLEMLMMPGGRERTAEEFKALFEKSGFELTKIVPTKSPFSVIEGRPRA